jgi:hypothetical protein
MFNTEFSEAYKAITARKKTRLIKYIASFYRRWYYSAIVKNTILTPANLLTWLNAEKGETEYYPVIKVSTAARLGAIRHEALRYTLDNHPFLSDFQVLLDTCMPDFELYGDDSLSNEHMALVLKNVSVFDPFYAEYMLAIAKRLGLVGKMPSIYANRAQLTSESLRFNTLSNREKLEKIVRAAEELVSERINALVDHSVFVTPDYIDSLLRNPVITDDILGYFFIKMGIHSSDIDAQDFESITDLHHSIVSGTFYLGILLDKFFFTPFAYYLRFISVEFAAPMEMHREMEYAADVFEDGCDELDVAMFAPCSRYHLTKLGADFFGVPAKNQYALAAPRNMPVSVLWGCLLAKSLDPLPSAIRSELFINSALYADSQYVYEIKIYPRNNSEFWKTIDFLECMSLHDAYIEICFEFLFLINMDYKFFADTTESAFTAYASPVGKKQAKMADSATLSELNLAAGHKFVLLLNCEPPFYMPESHDSTIRMDMEVRKVKKKKAHQFYPSVVKESQVFREAVTLNPFYI